MTHFFKFNNHVSIGKCQLLYNLLMGLLHFRLVSMVRPSSEIIKRSGLKLKIHPYIPGTFLKG